ncbi:MAG TPA: DUF1553 domain-containing protein [Pirellulales bacterium]|jgi:hypothetical protein|nr:DUF1553 domain-containing protein [Pirellulales bacterium]
MNRLLAVALLLSCGTALGAAPELPVDDEPQNDSLPLVRSDAKVVARWTFDRDEPGTWNKAAQTDDAGPRPPTFPSFSTRNRAAHIADGTRLTLADDDEPNESTTRLRFEQGESIAIEAWVRPAGLKHGQYAYVIGKGRSGNSRYVEKNQNYALRLKADTQGAKLSFLFASRADDDRPGDWHRWTTHEGLADDDAWHHIALTYTFGKPESVRGFIDGQPATGAWDMGGATNRPPVTDADELTIGSGNGNGANNSFRGWIDELVVYRGTLSADDIERRYVYNPPTTSIERHDVPVGRVLVQLCEQGLPSTNAWPTVAPPAAETYEEPAFGFVGLPQKYVDSGVRGDRANPLLLRAAAIVSLPAGKHRLLLRARSASRLTIDGRRVLSTPFQTGDGGGHQKVKPVEDYLNLGADFRFAPAGELEDWTWFDTPGGEHFVVFETIIGGAVGKAKRRPELGETVVAISPAGSEGWELLSPQGVIAYTDAAWPRYAAKRCEAIEQMNHSSRERQRAAHAKYWHRRREAARQWLADTSEIAIPKLPKNYPAQNAIDHFVAARLEAAKQQASVATNGGVDFFADVQPILEARCLSCHQGTAAQSGLRLDSRPGALRGGDSGDAAIVPSQPSKSPLLDRVASTDADIVMPPKGERLTAEQVAVLRRWIVQGATWPEFKLDRVELAPLCDDLAFLRRVTLDTVGVVPTLDEIRAFQADRSPRRREHVIDRLLADPRWADQWMGYWQDVLAENPNILNPTLNNTGPFRWWIYESLIDDKPMDLFATELVRMRGSERFGGPAGFAVASQNDAPFAAKGTIVSTAFLGVEMKCARCHDAPAHASKQQDLFQLAALLAKSPVEVPKTSSVALDKLSAGGRVPLIQVTLKPGTKVEPVWPFPQLCDERLADSLAEDPTDPRDRLASLITAPQNERFAQVIVNRLWKRLLGRGIVDPVEDWERGTSSHPELLRWLGRELVRNDYKLKPIARLILASHAYQRAVDPTLRQPSPLLAARAPRRLAAEQIVDSLFVATDKPFHVEEVNLDVDGRRDLKNSITLGRPTRAWMLTSTSNERDRPSLSLPRVQAVCDVLQAFGWRGARQDPASTRDEAPNALQPAILANGTMSIWLTRLSDDHGITRLALDDVSLDDFIDMLYLRMLTRQPTADERTRIVDYLRPGYEKRRREPPVIATAEPRQPRRYVSWSNHLQPDATLLRQQEEIEARRGDPPTERLDPAWRDRLENVVWSLVNAPEFVFAP